MKTRTPRPCSRAGRNRAFRTQSLVGWSNAGLGLLMILTDAGSTRPVVSTIAGMITRPLMPACLNASTGIILRIEPLLPVHRWNVSRNLRRHGDGLKPFERVGELHRLRINGLLLLLGCQEYDRCVHADAGVAQSGVEGCVHHRSDHRGMDYERRQTDAEPSRVAGLSRELEERENHGSTSGA